MFSQVHNSRIVPGMPVAPVDLGRLAEASREMDLKHTRHRWTLEKYMNANVMAQRQQSGDIHPGAATVAEMTVFMASIHQRGTGGTPTEKLGDPRTLIINLLVQIEAEQAENDNLRRNALMNYNEAALLREIMAANQTSRIWTEDMTAPDKLTQPKTSSQEEEVEPEESTIDMDTFSLGLDMLGDCDDSDLQGVWDFVGSPDESSLLCARSMVDLWAEPTLMCSEHMFDDNE